MNGLDFSSFGWVIFFLWCVASGIVNICWLIEFILKHLAIV